MLYELVLNYLIIMEPYTQISYEDQYDELKCIGRGNFGAAFLVKLRILPEDENAESSFIAKKIILGQLTPKEQEGALLEVIIFMLIETGKLIKEFESSEHCQLQNFIR